MNKTIVATTIHGEYKDVLLNKKYLRYSMKRIQSKDHRVATYKIYRISLSCFDDTNTIYIQNNRYDRLALGYYCQLWEKLFRQSKIFILILDLIRIAFLYFVIFFSKDIDLNSITLDNINLDDDG